MFPRLSMTPGKSRLSNVSAGVEFQIVFPYEVFLIFVSATTRSKRRVCNVMPYSVCVLSNA